MFNSTRISLLQTVLAGEEQAIVNGIDAQFEADSAEFKDGNVLFKAMPNRASFQNLLKNSKVVADRSKLGGNLQYRAWSPLFNSVTENIITANTKMTFTDAMESAYALYNALGSTFYGVLLISDVGERINPFHPLTAMSIITKGLSANELPKWTLAIYAYQDRKAMDSFYNTSIADPAMIAENLRDQINCYSGRANSEVRVSDKSYDSARKVVTVKYQVKKQPDEDTSREVMIVTHQLLTAGTIAPYYGTSVVQKKHRSQQVSGLSISPMISSNISADTFGPFSEFTNREYTIDNVRPNYGSVCTGSLDNKTYHGLRSLTHSNTSSPYNTEIIVDGALAYVDACIAKSIEIYKMAGIIKDPTDGENVQPDPVSPTNDSVTPDQEPN